MMLFNPQECAMPATDFSSVKLPAHLVTEAKQAAIAFRRSTAGQIEYWVMLGKAVEASGISVREAADALRQQDEQAARTQQLDAMDARFARAESSGSLTHRMREVIASNQASASQNTHKSQHLAA
jgi:hypothetical protein